MLTFISLLILLLTTTTAQPYKPTDAFYLDCGTSSSTSYTSPRWDGDENSKFVPSNFATTSFSSTVDHIYSFVTQVPYSTARIINTSSFTYAFPVSQGPKFLRLHFYPATYSGLDKDKSFFSVTSNGYSLLTNFSASLTASFINTAHLIKEYIVYVNDAQILNVTFMPSPNSYAFINGIEIVSIQPNLYLNATDPPKFFAQTTGPEINEKMAYETMYRLSMGGQDISGVADTGMNRKWDQDNKYISVAAYGLTPVYNGSITYTTETPNYTAPEIVYKTQRSMSNLSDLYNLTWILPVDSGFYYMLRLHFCNIIPQYTKKGQVIFKIFINNQTAEDQADLFLWTQGSGYPVYKDYALLVASPDGHESKQDLWVALQPNERSSERWLDGYLNGLEVFKLNTSIGNLASPNPDPDLDSTTPPVNPDSLQKGKKSKTKYYVIIGGVVGALVLLPVLVLIVLRQKRRVKHYGTADDRSSYGPVYSESKSTKSTHSTLPSDGCRRFSLAEVKVATDKFNDNCIIGHGGFGKVYKGYLDNATTTVAIKRLSTSSKQGFNEFKTEIQLMSKLHNVHLVSLIGYCDDNGEMILVYDYMARGTLREHLYKTNNPPLSWKTRLNICIGAAKGLHYLHTSEKRTIIHRDIKSTNILLDENWFAKVSDFGLSKKGSENPSETHVTTMVKGSLGYIDPEYCKSEHLREKSDVYSFGVVLLEVLCARPVIDPWVPGEQVNLAEWGKISYQRGTLAEIIDPKISGEIEPSCLRKFGEVANSCLHEEGNKRPTMEEVVKGLEFALELQEAAAEKEKMGGITIGEEEGNVVSESCEGEKSQIIELVK